jgi:hypothetical protein
VAELISAVSGMGGWSIGASILSFAFPMILFLAVAASLFVAYTKPSVVPGHREQTVARPVGFTPVVRLPAPGQVTAEQVPAGPQYVTGTEQVPAPRAPTAGDSDETAAPDDPPARPGNPGGAE